MTTQWRKYLKRSGSGRPEYADPVTFPCTIRGKITAVRDAKGIERMSSQVMVLAVADELSQEDQFTLFGKPNIPIAVSPYFSERGKLAGWEVFF